MGVEDRGLLANIQTTLQQAVLIEQSGSERGGVGECDGAPAEVRNTMQVTLSGGDDDAADPVGSAGTCDDSITEIFGDQNLIRVDDCEIENTTAQFGIVGIRGLRRFHPQRKSSASAIQCLDELSVAIPERSGMADGRHSERILRDGVGYDRRRTVERRVVRRLASASGQED